MTIEWLFPAVVLPLLFGVWLGGAVELYGVRHNPSWARRLLAEAEANEAHAERMAQIKRESEAKP